MPKNVDPMKCHSGFRLRGSADKGRMGPPCSSPQEQEQSPSGMSSRLTNYQLVGVELIET